jgi:hypothetical protein
LPPFFRYAVDAGGAEGVASDPGLDFGGFGACLKMPTAMHATKNVAAQHFPALPT